MHLNWPNNEKMNNFKTCMRWGKLPCFRFVITVYTFPCSATQRNFDVVIFYVEDYYCFIWVNIYKFCALTSTESGKVKLSSRNNLISSGCNTFHTLVGWITPFKPELSLYYIKSKAFVWCIWSHQSFPFESFFFIICLVFLPKFNTTYVCIY